MVETMEGLTTSRQRPIRDCTLYLTGPDPILELTYNDVWLPGIVSRRILCFEISENSDHGQVIDVVSRGLKALVQGTPELGATSIVVPQGAPHDNTKPWRALVPGDGIHLIVKDMTQGFPTYTELEAAGFPISAFKDSEFMPASAFNLPAPQPQSRFQLNLIEGGVCLAYCIYHHLTDGNGMNIISKALGEECAKAYHSSRELPPRELLRDRGLLPRVTQAKLGIASHPAYRLLSGIHLPGRLPEDTKTDTTLSHDVHRAQYYHLTNIDAQRIKIEAGKHGAVSTHDAVCALVWKTLIKTRYTLGQLSNSDRTFFTIPHDGRKHLGIPSEWLGNLVYFIVAEASVSEILLEDSLPLLARKIRSELSKINREVVEDMLALRCQDPYSIYWWPDLELNEPHLVGFTSMYHSKILGQDWGPALGVVKHFTASQSGAFARACQRAHFVGPMLPGGKGCNVHVGLLEEEVPHFASDPLWKKFFSLLETSPLGPATADAA